MELEEAEGLTGSTGQGLEELDSLIASPEHFCGEPNGKDCPHPRMQSPVVDAVYLGERVLLHHCFLPCPPEKVQPVELASGDPGGHHCKGNVCMERADDKQPVLSLRVPL